MQKKFVTRKFLFNLRDFLSMLVLGVTRCTLVKGRITGGWWLVFKVIPEQVVGSSYEEATEE